MNLATVSGNTVSGNTPPPPGSDTVPGTVTNNNTYTMDSTAVCDLLTALLNEEVKQNEALTQLNETLAAHAESLAESNLSDGLQGKILVEDLETETSIEETAETDRQVLLDFLQTISDTLTGSKETLDSINVTVSGNNAFLDSMDGTTTALQETYAEQTEKNMETESYSLSTGFTILFGIAFISGILLSKISWRKMR
ncbi:MAG: hypothetical protein K2K54_05680 [Lachnospiraceae bacterium]|nr:hypothetical protein [Lachnospiraceae bacterium]